MDRKRTAAAIAVAVFVSAALAAFAVQTYAPPATRTFTTTVPTTIIELRTVNSIRTVTVRATTGIERPACVATTYESPDTVGYTSCDTTSTSGTVTYTYLTGCAVYPGTSTSSPTGFTTPTFGNETAGFVTTSTSQGLSIWTITACTLVS